MAEESLDRFQSAGDFEAALVDAGRSVTESGPDATDGRTGAGRATRRFPTRMAALVGLGAILGVGIYLMTRGTPELTGPGSAPYDVEATFLLQKDGGVEPLLSGNRVEPGDRLTLDFQASRPLHVYILNEDDAGESYLLFPGPGYDLKNPLEPGTSHRLPGTISRNDASWKVTSAGGREHFLIVASPVPLPDLEKQLTGISVPEVDRPIDPSPVRLRPPAGELLRGVGGLEISPVSGNQPRRMTDIVRGLAGRESKVSGVWIRKVVLENSGSG